MLPVFESGDQVWYNDPIRPQNVAKGQWKPWVGPYQVIEAYQGVSYKIVRVDDPVEVKTVHFSRLKRYFDPVPGSIVMCILREEEEKERAD